MQTALDSREKPRPDTPLKVAVIIVTFNNADTIETCIASALSQSGFSLNNDLLVLLADNNSTDGTVDLVNRAFGEEIILCKNSSNLGFSLANNQEIAKALNLGADYVMLLNPDVRLNPNALRYLVDALKVDPFAGAACPKLYRSDTALKPIMPLQFDSTGMYMTPALRHFDRGSNVADVGQFDAESYVFGASGAAVVFSRPFILDAAFHSGNRGEPLELFDNSFFIYREDADLAWRGQWLGWKCRYVPKAVGYHRRVVLPERRRQLPSTLNRYGVQNRFLLQLNNFSFIANYRCIPKGLWRNVLVVVACLTIERSSLAGLFSVFRLLPKALRQRKSLFTKRRASKLSMSRLFSDKPLSEPALSSTRSINPVNALHIVIINFNSGEHLLNCLNSVAESISTLSATLDVMVTVIDNASTDNSAKEAASKFGARQRFSFHLLPTNLGFGGGINKALEADNSAAALILNPDVKISADCIFKLIEALDNCDNLGAVAPLLRDEAGKIDERYLPRRFPTLGSTIAELFYLHRLFPANPWTASYLGKDDYCFSKYFREALFPEASKVCLSKNPFLVEQPAAACLMVRAAAFKAISGFDERYWPAWFEDVDFSKRLLESNWLSAFLASARAIHAGGHSLKFITNAQFAHIWYGNMARYWRKHASRRQYSVFASVLRLAILLRSGVNLLWGLWQFATGRRGASRRALNLAKALLRRAISPFSQ